MNSPVRDRGTVALVAPAPVTHRTPEENLGLGYLASALRHQGWSVTVVDAWLGHLSLEETIKQAVATAPVAVGVSAYLSNIGPAMDLARGVRAALHQVHLVAGGFGPTFAPEDFLRGGFDYVIRGEGEVALPHLMEALISSEIPRLGQVPGLVTLRDGQPWYSSAPTIHPDLDQLRVPSRETLGAAQSHKTPIHILSSRGCMGSCVFCSVVAFGREAEVQPWRARSVPSVVAELTDLHRQGVRHVKFVDDSLIEPPRGVAWASELADAMEDAGLRMRLRGSIRAERVTDSLLAALARAGFYSFSCGIENFSDTALARMGKRARVEDNYRALDAFLAHGYIVQAGHILFDDQTTLEELEDNYRGFVRYPWTISKGIFSEMFAAAGTNFTRRLEHRGSVTGEGGLGNSRYVVADERVMLLREHMRAWQRAHSVIYDKAIDPLSAPKVIEGENLDCLLNIAQHLRHVDIDFFRKSLDLTHASTTTHELEGEFSRYRKNALRETQDDYAALDAQVDAVYEAAALTYRADPNPFF